LTTAKGNSSNNNIFTPNIINKELKRELSTEDFDLFPKVKF
jgi:hypothetical protein